MSSFRKRAEMFFVAPKCPLLPHFFRDNTMPVRDWDAIEAPTSKRAPVVKFDRIKNPRLTILLARRKRMGVKS